MNLILILAMTCAVLFFDKSFGASREAAVISHPIEEVLEKHTDELMSIPGVIAVGEGLCDSKPCIKVYLIKKSAESDKRIPGTIDGYRVSTEVTGTIEAQPVK